MSVHLYSQL